VAAEKVSSEYTSFPPQHRVDPVAYLESLARDATDEIVAYSACLATRFRVNQAILTIALAAKDEAR
jgi:hypothetical protein